MNAVRHSVNPSTIVTPDPKIGFALVADERLLALRRQYRDWQRRLDREREARTWPPPLCAIENVTNYLAEIDGELAERGIPPDAVEPPRPPAPTQHRATGPRPVPAAAVRPEAA